MYKIIVLLNNHVSIEQIYIFRRHQDNENQLKKMNGLYINAGHGAKGLVNAPLCAEIIASLINGDPLPVSKSLAGALNPNRFLLREMGLKKLATSLIEPS